MKDIKINTPVLKAQYIISWIGLIITANILMWAVIYGLSNYGKDTSLNKKKKKGLLNEPGKNVHLFMVQLSETS